jgi:peptide methionine sulfoxide reductase msrA/msrB
MALLQRVWAAPLLLILLVAAGCSRTEHTAAKMAPEPSAPRAAAVPQEERQVAVLAGGCFWGMEELLRKLPGVIDTSVGYTGGTVDQPGYEDVHTGTSGHAESVRIEFDPKEISYERLLLYFFTIHDPTTKNRQGNDIGSQYRSAIFVQSAEQRRVAEVVVEKVNASGDWKDPVTTQILSAGEFFSAEDYHQDYLRKNPGGYTCHYERETSFY